VGIRGFEGSRRPSVVKVGEELEVQISDLSRRGDGIARYQGLVIFVPNTARGDRVKVRVTNVGRSFATAEKV